MELPWLTPEGQKDKQFGKTDQEQFTDMRNQWIKYWGDPADPVVAEKIRLTAEALMRDTLRMQANRRR
jgi:hypothetical protein